MITYWRKWQLVRLISNECIETNAGVKTYSIEKTKRFIQNNTTYYGNLGTKEIDLILEKTPSDSVVNFEVILKRISGDKKIPRAEYQKILEDAESDGLVKIVKNETLPPNSDLTQIYVGITGKGLIFSRIDTLLHEVFLESLVGWLL